jgi:hypothetical protein
MDLGASGVRFLVMEFLLCRFEVGLKFSPTAFSLEESPA